MRYYRRGITLAETTVAMLLLAAAIVAVAQLSAGVAAQRGVSHRAATARLEAANQLEQLFVRPWEALNQDRDAGLELSASCREVLPAAELRIEVSPAAGQPLHRRLRVEVSWQEFGEQIRRTAGLTAWRYAGGEGGQP
jgi:hypothetical protein